MHMNTRVRLFSFNSEKGCARALPLPTIPFDILEEGFSKVLYTFGQKHTIDKEHKNKKGADEND